MSFYFRIIAIYLLFGCTVSLAQGHFYTAKNINVLIESADLTTARDQGLLQAQKRAVLGLVSATDPSQLQKLKSLNDASLSRTMKDFSLQGERLGTGSYEARFMIRFDGVRLDNLLGSYGITVPASSEVDLAHVQTTAPAEEPADANEGTATKPATTTEQAAIKPTLIILPVLDIGSRRVVWDEPNPWRDSWQKKNNPTTSHYNLMVPLGDVTDITDIPDGRFLSKDSAIDPEHIRHMLERYSAEKIYILVARSQGAALNPTTGLEIKAYSHDGKKLQSAGIMNSTARPGYLFDDAVDFTIQKMDSIADGTFGKGPAATVSPVTKTIGAIAATQQGTGATAVIASSPVVLVPIPNLSAWVGIQQKLRRVNGVRNLVTQTISPQAVTVRIESSEPADILLGHIAASGFIVTPRSDGTFILKTVY